MKIGRVERITKSGPQVIYDPDRATRKNAAIPAAILRPFSEIHSEALKWLWPGRIPLGKLSLLVGDPGLGKSLATIDIAARVSRGLSFPDGEECEPGAVIMASAEDDPADTIRPRLDNAGADVSRVHTLEGTRIILTDASAVERAFDLETGIAKRVENRDIPLIAFAHESVSREGIRELLHINPVPFKTEADVLVKLPGRLKNLTVAEASTIALRFEVFPMPRQDEHTISQLRVTLYNGTNGRITTYSGKLWVPKPLLTHWDGARYAAEETTSATQTHRCFQFSEQGKGAINPRDSMPPLSVEYCTQCAIDRGSLSPCVSEMEFEVPL